MAESYDYLVVGSGAAGSVIAARLAEAGAGSVCVLEAGGDNRRLLVDIPAGFVRNLNKPDLMWQFESVPTQHTGNRSVYLPQGRILGGSTSLNGLVYNRGQTHDFDHWASMGNTGWTYQELLPYFRKSETFHRDTQYRGSSGPLRINEPEQTHPLCDRFIDAVSDMTGVEKNADYNGNSQIGTGYYQRFIHRGKRENVADRFLKPQLQSNKVTIKTNSLVKRVLFSQKRATGVEVFRDGDVSEIRANVRVLVCAGTVNSASLLQRSGVGDGQLLQALNIPVVHHLPGVGNNFQDHYFARMAFRLNDGEDSLNLQSKGLRLAKEVLRWIAGKPSILAWSPSIAYAFLHADSVLQNKNYAVQRPDLQFVFSHGSYRPGRIYELDSFPAVTCGFTQQRPYSRGFVKIASRSVFDKPVVQPNYLLDERDQLMAVKGVKIARRLMQSDWFSPVFRCEQFPGKDIQSDDEILNFVRDTGNTGYHLVGTCKMGPETDPLAVVDSELKVHGLQNISVADASIMPTVTSSNTCAAAIMIGEKAADMLVSA